MQTSLIKANKDNLYQLNRFYKRNGHKGKATEQTPAFWLEHNKQIVAAVRFEIVEFGLLLRGLWVEKKLRGQGLGSELLKQLTDYMTKQPCYCLTYNSEVQFYQKQRFTEAKATAPDALVKQWQRYQRRGEELKIMQFTPSNYCPLDF